MPARKHNLTLTNTKNMEFKGTQGKLHLEEIREDNYLSISNEKNNSVASISTNEEQYEEAVAYGRLFSKAPEMLEMLQKACTEFYRIDNAMATEVKQLIKEATLKTSK